MEIQTLGLQRYTTSLEIMNGIHSRLVQDTEASGTILVVEHPPVVTMGNRFLPDDMHVNGEFLNSRGIDFEKIDRGGSVTVHEPGQAVVYPLMRLGSSLTVRRFVWCLEEAMIQVAATFGVEGRRDPINAGIWVGENKLGAVGIRVSEHVSKHGLAFNVCNDLATFQWIIPCGLRTRGVTNLAREMQKVGNNNSKALSAIDIGNKIASTIAHLVRQ